MNDYFRVFMICGVIFMVFTNSYNFICNSDAEEDVFSGNGLVRYLIEVDVDWSSVSHPEDFPASGTFSEFTGVIHKEDNSFWDPGALASPGLARAAETGLNDVLQHEIEAIIENKQAFKLIVGDGIPTVDGRMKVITETNIKVF